MFYCEPCRVRLDWPDALTTSYGPCEVCGKTGSCYDRPSSSLPAAKRAKAPSSPSESAEGPKRLLRCHDADGKVVHTVERFWGTAPRVILVRPEERRDLVEFSVQPDGSCGELEYPIGLYVCCARQADPQRFVDYEPASVLVL